ncbi:phosphoribosylanthranilate isomerase [Roseicyclus sp. F158]|uniref:N-(5'-phosphoribosyl)anthranilate isomerase n=1 Tax=Tropicimonas omnivorans TaxID=3075590 RepID=A0ABU3DGV2_9RHOB|nr:phosphoribosylanthranilate isomerase [Roseicyclus sp. F158]MDT0682783.1 phosphoribosylanthranilate isomerase [Roseicyclus sp. F158]
MTDSSGIRIKVCGLTRPEDVTAIAEAGADYAGFVFYEPSPRNIGLDVAAELTRLVPDGIEKVALTVNAPDALFEGLLDVARVDLIQCHGNEGPQRLEELRDMFGLPVMKAITIATEADLEALPGYLESADQLLIDAKGSAADALPGGNGESFDWSLLEGVEWDLPWMLAGGLTPDNVGEAIRVTGAGQVDVSSGVESARGIKDAGLIRAFCDAARAAG